MEGLLSTGHTPSSFERESIFANNHGRLIDCFLKWKKNLPLFLNGNLLWVYLVLVLLSTHVERFSVTRMRDLKKISLIVSRICPYHTGRSQEYIHFGRLHQEENKLLFLH